MASLQKVLRPAARRAAFARQVLRPISTTPAFRASVSNAPPRDPPAQADIGVGELEGAKFKIEPMRRVGEDDKTMRARLVCMCFLPNTCHKFPCLHFGNSFSPLGAKVQFADFEQTRAANAAPSNLTSSSPPSPTSTCPR